MTAIGLPRVSVLRYMIRVPVAMIAPSWPDGSSTSRDGSVRIRSPGWPGGNGSGGL